MVADRREILIAGSGPYGFRLTGGDGHPLAVNKLRKQSKAFEVGLQEGDTILGINGYTCRAMSHGAAMTLLENTANSLHLVILRGDVDANTLNSAFDQLSSQLRPLSPGSLPPARKLPPPPAVETGALVIDQPSFLRQNWTPAQEHRHPPPPTKLETNFNHGDSVGHGAPMVFSTTIELQTKPSSIDVPPTHSTLPASGSAPQIPFRVATYGKGPKPWAPAGSGTGPGDRDAGRKPTSSEHRPNSEELPTQFHVSRNMAWNNKDKPWMWHPSGTYTIVRAREHDEKPETETEKETEPETTEEGTLPDYVRVVSEFSGGRHPDRVDAAVLQGDVEIIPRWALPLRSDYDWRTAYYWLAGDDWEFTEDGQYAIRKKKKVPTATLR